MKTILHICDWYTPIGGAEKLLFDTLAALEANGHMNVVVYNDHPNQRATGQRPEYACENLEFHVYHHPGSPLLARQCIPRLREIIERHAPDVCHIHNFQNSYATEFLIGAVPCVRSLHDPRLYCFTNWRLLPDKSICPYPMGRECLRQGCLSRGAFPRSDADRNAYWVLRHRSIHARMPVLICESRAQIECVLQNGFSAEQISWLPNMTAVRPEEEVRAFLREHHDPSDRIVLFVGRASYEKGIHVLVDACRHVKSACRIVIITAGPLLGEVTEQAAVYGGRIQVIPGLPYEETRKYYARASVVVVPSVWIENFCLIGLETFACMKPVIGSRVGGIKDWLKDGETGWFFEPGDARGLAERIDLALSDSERLQRMGEAAYRRVRMYYNQDLYVSRLLEIYQKGIDRFQERIRP